ncbi:acyltransferase [Pseudoroseicyclus aestuarii]|uniref:Surface polysaccharide O-acyltransferase-like enzyme n=1 Tax=Pseudoroseicyclus aestuarii TaxID=1795041 RepID=A0A318STQ3_9RHOB|nr:acyltransferase [Pseudoroseicyclus aestuarii]PYE84735.1 surface polysaccharide O-acyltransferase-like enzyme [Pseudoroseicyclus aestuarii]
MSTAPASPSARLLWLDALRVLAGVSIICMHASAAPDGSPFSDATPAGRALPVLLQTLFYMARTELFLVISLFLLAMSLHRRPRGYGAVIAEQAQRLLVPFVFWVAVYVCVNLALGYHLGWGHYLLRALTSQAEIWIGYLLLGDVKQHMHFLPTLFALVLAFPLYRMAVARPALGLVLIPLLILKRQLNMAVWGGIEDPVATQYLLRAIRIATYTGYGLVGAAFYGIFLRVGAGGEGGSWDRARSARLQRAVLTSLGLLALACLWIKFGQAMAVIQSGTWSRNYPNADSAHLLMPVALFGLVMLAPLRWPGWIGRLAPYSFGIFLVHPMLLDLFRLIAEGRIMTPSLYVLTNIGFAVAGSYALALALSRVPALSWTIGLGPLPWARRRAGTRPLAAPSA